MYIKQHPISTRTTDMMINAYAIQTEIDKSKSNGIHFLNNNNTFLNNSSQTATMDINFKNTKNEFKFQDQQQQTNELVFNSQLQDLRSQDTTKRLVNVNNTPTKSHICRHCLNPLSLFQLNNEEALRFCTNLQCLQYLNWDETIRLDEESCIIKRDVKEAGAVDLLQKNYLNDQDYMHYESLNLNSIFNNMLNNECNRLNADLERYNSINKNNENEIELTAITSPLISPVNNFNIFDEVQQPFFNQTNQLPTTDVSMSQNLNNEPNQFIQQVIPELQIATTYQYPDNSFMSYNQAHTPAASSSTSLFDDNFFSDINNLLDQDCEMSNDQTYTDSVIDLNDQSQTSQHLNETISFRSILTASNMQPTSKEQDKSLISLKPANPTDVASKLASNVCIDEFMNANLYNNEEANVSVNSSSNNNTNNTIDSIEKILYHSESKEGNSKITISKIIKPNIKSNSFNEKTNPVNTSIQTNSLKQASTKAKPIKISNFNILDEKEELIALIDSKKQQPALKNDQRTGLKKNPSISSNISQMSNDIDQAYSPISNLIEKSTKKNTTLLPWELKTKGLNKRKPKMEPKSPIRNLTPNRSTASLLSKLDTKISRVDLIQKTNDSPSNMKERGSILKKALLNDASFLSNLNLGLNQSESSPLAPKGSGGYKDLVLNVLKKKTTA